jgi:hypothetical protein
MNTFKLAKQLTGGLGNPSKMPGTSYGISAHKCKTGAKLAQIEGSVCYGCYALGGNYQYPSVTKAHANRHGTWADPRWPSAMAMLILKGTKAKGENYHRWHDSGDLQSVEHLDAICRVATLTRQIKHWIPTRELGMVKAYREQYGPEPANLCIRVSATMVDGPATKAWAQTSGVHTSEELVPEGTDICRAPDHDNKCGPCRKCWNKEVEHVSYHLHH